MERETREDVFVCSSDQVSEWSPTVSSSGQPLERDDVSIKTQVVIEADAVSDSEVVL